MTKKQRERENLACEAIIACLMRGHTSKRFWKKVFKKVDALEELKGKATK